ncbi:MAG TPA: M20/M25/M40 family metallo-hydrolase [Pseudobdellovibrionaceae bacterium]|nr:M20/M25/M40 family metallo-hydrolase [Pseudobdellovibrionaceae bacterium]
MSRLKFLAFGVLVPMMAGAHGPQSMEQVEALSDLNLLKVLNIPILAQDTRAGVGYAVLTPEMQEKISMFNHSRGRCGGFEVLPPTRGPSVENRFRELRQLGDRVEKDVRWARSGMGRRLEIGKKQDVQEALDKLKEENLRPFVEWASSFPTRYNKGANANVAVEALAGKIRDMAKALRAPIQIELISHTSTPQKSLMVRVPGNVAPQEVVVIGAHFDSIAGWTGGSRAPGADDNASGSANIFEALRVLLMTGPTARTVEFYWYAGEESGLLGSAEIAKAAKEQKRQIVGVLQLDMTLFPGSGELVIGNMTDFTSAWLRDFLVSANQNYLGAQLVDDQCGYGCSDHASWYRQGFPTLMPFESTFSRSDKAIHTPNDVINNHSNFRHSHVFSKIALLFALELGNNNVRQPY